MKSYDENINEEVINEIKEFLSNSKELTKKLGLKENKNFEITIEEFIEQDRKIKKDELVSIIIKNSYGYIVSISDILDAIYIGRYSDGCLKMPNGKRIEGNFGHGQRYYHQGIEYIFDEIIANYNEIIKCQESKKALNELRECIGDNLFKMLTEFYEEKIFYNQKYMSEKSL